MTYDFDTLIDRRGTNSLKWAIAEGELPMWVADMDFPTAPAITRAVQDKAASGVFGYGIVPDSFADSIATWWQTRHGFRFDPEWISFCDGIVPAISSLVRTLAEPGQGIIVQPPVYHCFYHSIENSSRRVVRSDLVYDQGRYDIDWAGVETAMGDPAATVFLLCNPQNPTGQIWSREDLARLGGMAAAHGLVVISDEIHCDITAPGTSYTPFAAVDETCARVSITLVSPTKSFNIPGLQTAAMIIPDPDLRSRARLGLDRDEITGPNSFAVEAAIAAYTHGAEWLDELRVHVWKNKERLASYLAERLPKLTVVPSQATYLSWIDCTAVVDDDAQFCDFLRETTGLVLNTGSIYGDNARGFVRMNLACPTARLDDGLERLAAGVAAWQSR